MAGVTLTAHRASPVNLHLWRRRGWIELFSARRREREVWPEPCKPQVVQTDFRFLVGPRKRAR